MPGVWRVRYVRLAAMLDRATSRRRRGLSMTQRHFYETTITVKVLSEEPFEWDDLPDIAYAITDGSCVGDVKEASTRRLDGKETADTLAAFGSESGFFNLTEAGDDTEDA